MKEIRSFMHDSKMDTTGKTKDVETMITEELEDKIDNGAKDDVAEQARPRPSRGCGCGVGCGEWRDEA